MTENINIIRKPYIRRFVPLFIKNFHDSNIAFVLLIWYNYDLANFRLTALRALRIEVQLAWLENIR